MSKPRPKPVAIPDSNVTVLAPTRLTPKQYKFARLYVETGNASEAYRQSYDVSPEAKPEGIRVEASRLLADPNITLAVADLQKHALAESRLTGGLLISEALDLLEAAKAEQDTRGSVAALALLDKIHARLTPSGGIGNRNPDDMSEVGLQTNAIREKMSPSRQWLENLLANSKEQQAAEDKARVGELLDKLGYRLVKIPEADSEFAAILLIDDRANN